jgi:acylphosphatase
VFFRETTRRQAELLGLTGYAVNLADGRVEVLACGVSEQVEQMASWLWEGSSMAKVSQVEELPCNDQPPTAFTTGWQ